MTRVEILDGRLKIEVLGWHKLWAFKSRLDFPLEHVAGAQLWEGKKRRFSYGFRAPGTYVPGLIVAGTFHGWRQSYFYDVCDFARAIVIELQDERYVRVIVEVEEPEAVLRLITGSVVQGPELAVSR